MTALPALASRFALTPDQVAALDRYITLVLGWRRGRVTGLRSRDDAVDTLVGDALALLDVIEGGREARGGAAGRGVPDRLRLLDLGSGGGAPGLPLAVAAPQLSVVLLDSVRKKCDFLTAAVDELGMTGRVTVVCARSESFTAAGGEGREAFDLVTARAVGALAEVVELAAPALTPSGRLLALKTGVALESEGAAGNVAAGVCGLASGAVVPLPASPLADSVCVTFAKLSPVPDWLPRRAGVAGRRPL
ncbi:MAG TPA: 16S rRNA (guanine(527)-N(7))-methyltransferase RsmG, partial [Thermoleophilia bacterium]|nr:16S rRNA (guanine(527)-N(7))-methyltransferase RsmG [Thermoleophilia bacterium]